MKSVVGLGAGGHAEVIIEILRSTGLWDLVGLLDSNEKLHGTSIAGVPVVGGDDLLEALAAKGVCEAFIGVGGFGASACRRELFLRAQVAGMDFPVIIHERAWISPSARLGAGSVVMAGSVVNTSAILGENVIVNTSASIDHHCRIGDFVHVAPGAVIAGRVEIGEEVQIGAGAVIRDGVRIGRRSVVGAGATVVSEIAENKLALGTPAREVRDVS